MGKPEIEVDDVSAPTTTSGSSIFSSLFGQNDGVSSGLFSDNNPFKRKPQNDDVAPLKLNEEDVKEKIKIKIKKKKSKIEKADVEEEEFGSIKVKRKRDDVERVYEAKKYGESVDATNENEDELRKGKGKGKGKGVDVAKKKKETDDVDDDDDDDDDDNVVGPKEGFDDESKLIRTVFVGNLPVTMKKKVLMKEFNKFGEIESVRIRSVPLTDTKKPVKGAIMQKQINENADSVHAYIVFKTEESADASLSHNMSVVEGNHIRVDKACAPRKKLTGENAAPLYDNYRTVFLGNLPFDVKDEELYRLFSGINGLESSVEAVRVIRQPRVGMGKGIAYVLFKTREAANLAIRKRNLYIHDRELRLSHAKQDSTPSKRNDSRNDGPPRNKFTRNFTASGNGVNKPISKASMSYQGLRGNKSNDQKKFQPRNNKSNDQKKFQPRINNGQMNFNARKDETPKARTSKRPAVAARREKPGNKAGGSSSHAGAKRKMDSRTTEKNKKFKKSR